MDDLISRQAALALAKDIFVPIKDGTVYCHRCIDPQQIRELPSAWPKSTRTFVELVVEYPPPELCTYKEYKGKPYYSIKYIENGKMYVGYGTYNPEALSQYLKEYFMSPAQQEIIRCKDCKHLQKWRSEESVKKFGQIYECARNVFDCPKPEDFCSHAERKYDDCI